MKHPRFLNAKTQNVEFAKILLKEKALHSCLPLAKSWLPSCLDRGALINVDAQGCGTSVVLGPMGHK